MSSDEVVTLSRIFDYYVFYGRIGVTSVRPIYKGVDVYSFDSESRVSVVHDLRPERRVPVGVGPFND